MCWRGVSPALLLLLVFAGRCSHGVDHNSGFGCVRKEEERGQQRENPHEQVGEEATENEGTSSCRAAEDSHACRS
eukprot:2552417-Rhodomonas_salina.1